MIDNCSDWPKSNNSHLSALLWTIQDPTILPLCHYVHFVHYGNFGNFDGSGSGLSKVPGSGSCIFFTIKVLTWQPPLSQQRWGWSISAAPPSQTLRRFSATKNGLKRFKFTMLNLGNMIFLVNIELPTLSHIVLGMYVSKRQGVTKVAMSSRSSYFSASATK